MDRGRVRLHRPSNRSHRLVITARSLLGVTWPGVTSLEDLKEVLAQNCEVQDPVRLKPEPTSLWSRGSRGQEAPEAPGKFTNVSFVVARQPQVSLDTAVRYRGSVYAIIDAAGGGAAGTAPTRGAGCRPRDRPVLARGLVEHRRYKRWRRGWRQWQCRIG